MEIVRVKQEHLDYLDELRESGINNALGAGDFLEDKFNLDPEEARATLIYWMTTYQNLTRRVRV